MTKEEIAALKAENEALKAKVEKLEEEVVDPAHSQLLGKVLIEPFPELLENLRAESIEINNALRDVVEDGLSAMNRHQKNAISDIRLGFVNDVARFLEVEAALQPYGFDATYFHQLMEQLNYAVVINTELGSAMRLMRDVQIVTGDVLFNLALLWYRNIQVLSERRVPGAEAIYRELRTHFRRHSSLRSDQQPTEKQILRDAKALLHGKKDGEIVIEGHAKHTTPTEKRVIDDVHRPLGKNFKETVSGTVCKHCGCENGADYVFCKKCGGKL
jgi:hypothetical protein